LIEQVAIYCNRHGLDDDARHRTRTLDIRSRCLLPTSSMESMRRSRVDIGALIARATPKMLGPKDRGLASRIWSGGSAALPPAFRAIAVPRVAGHAK
jgi:hypothetical protein